MARSTPQQKPALLARITFIGRTMCDRQRDLKTGRREYPGVLVAKVRQIRVRCVARRKDCANFMTPSEIVFFLHALRLVQTTRIFSCCFKGARCSWSSRAGMRCAEPKLSSGPDSRAACNQP